MATNSDIITHRKLGFALSRISQNTCLEIKNDVAKTKNTSANLECLYCKKKNPLLKYYYSIISQNTEYLWMDE